MNFNQLPPRTIKQTNQIMTFYRISDIPVSEHNENKLFFIKQLNNYYRYNPDNEHFEVAVVVPNYGDQMLSKQDLLITSDSIDIQDNVITVKENILNTINNNTSTISGLQNTKQEKLTASENILINSSTNVISVDFTDLENAITLKQDTLTAGSNITITDNIVSLNNSIDISGYVVSNTMTTNSIQSNTGLHEFLLMKSISNPSNPSTITINNNKLEWNNGGHSIQRYSCFFASEVHTQYETTPISSQNTLVTKSYVDNQIASGISNGHTFLEYASSTLYIDTTNKIINLQNQDLYLERTIIGEYLQMQTSSGLPSIKIDANFPLISGATELPTEDDHLTNKAYVDSSISSIIPTNNKIELIIQVITHNRTVKLNTQDTTNISSFISYCTEIAPKLYNINLNSIVTFSNSMNTTHYLGYQILRKADNKVLTTPDSYPAHVYLKSTLFKNHETKNDSWVFNNNILLIDGVVSSNGLITGFSTAIQNSSNVAVFGQFVIVADFLNN